jgi:hypothetical protein
MKIWIASLILCLLACAVPVSAAQVVCPNPCVVGTGTPYSVAADHDGVNTEGFNLYLDTVKVGTVPVSALLTGVVTFKGLLGPAKGAHSLVMGAYNTDIDGTVNEAQSTALAFSSKKVPPGKPSNVRILVSLNPKTGVISLRVVNDDGESVLTGVSQ